MTTRTILRPAARRDVVTMMRRINDVLRNNVSRWTQTGKIYDQRVEFTGRDGKPAYNLAPRPRRADELPENQRAAWVQLADEMAAVLNAANDVRLYALDMIELFDRK